MTEDLQMVVVEAVVNGVKDSR